MKSIKTQNMSDIFRAKKKFKRLLRTKFFFPILIILIMFSQYFIGENTHDSSGNNAKIIRVMDGDSLKVFFRGEELEVRLYGIDAPEQQQKEGARSKKFLEGLLPKNSIREMIVVKKDQYGRSLAVLYDEKKTDTVQELLLRNGLAFVYRNYCKTTICDSFKEAEAYAKRNSIGLWKEENLVFPWEFRKENRR